MKVMKPTRFGQFVKMDYKLDEWWVSVGHNSDKDWTVILRTPFTDCAKHIVLAFVAIGYKRMVGNEVVE